MTHYRKKDSTTTNNHIFEVLLINFFKKALNILFCFGSSYLMPFSCFNVKQVFFVLSTFFLFHSSSSQAQNSKQSFVQNEIVIAKTNLTKQNSIYQNTINKYCIYVGVALIVLITIYVFLRLKNLKTFFSATEFKFERANKIIKDYKVLEEQQLEISQSFLNDFFVRMMSINNLLDDLKKDFSSQEITNSDVFLSLNNTCNKTIQVTQNKILAYNSSEIRE